MYVIILLQIMDIIKYDDLINTIKLNQITDEYLSEIKKIMQKLFTYSCKIGHLDVAEWLYYQSKTDENQKININATNDLAFRQSCENGHLDVAEWLYCLSKTDGNQKIYINAMDDFAFRRSCAKGHLDVADWLYYQSKTDENQKININANDEDAFRKSCLSGHLDVAEWLYGLSKTDGNRKINININDDHAFTWSCLNGYNYVAEWLCTLCNDYKIKYDSDGKMIPSVRNIKTIFLENDCVEIDKLYETSEIRSIDNICIICLTNDNKYWVELDCSHLICNQCFSNIDRCPYRCFQNINIEQIKLIINIDHY